MFIKNYKILRQSEFSPKKVSKGNLKRLAIICFKTWHFELKPSLTIFHLEKPCLHQKLNCCRRCCRCHRRCCCHRCCRCRCSCHCHRRRKIRKTPWAGFQFKVWNLSGCNWQNFYLIFILLATLRASPLMTPLYEPNLEKRRQIRKVLSRWKLYPKVQWERQLNDSLTKYQATQTRAGFGLIQVATKQFKTCGSRS